MTGMMSFDITPDDGDPYRVTAYSRDVLTWEKALKGRSFGQMADNPTMVGMYGLAYIAARRQGLFSGTLAEFEASVDLDPADEEEDGGVDPTHEGPSPGPSSSSPSPPASPPASGPKKAKPRSSPRST